MNEKTFAELYCEQNKTDPQGYEREVLVNSLYPHARLVAWLLMLLNPNQMAADYDFVRAVGALKRFRDFEYEAQEYAHHPANRGFWRMKMNLRVSSRALRRMVKDTLHPHLSTEVEDEAASVVPFDRKKRSSRSGPAKRQS